METRDYDFRVVDSPDELHELIRQKNKAKNKARMVAGYCWKWISKNNSLLKDIVIGNYKATWNLDSDGQAWIIKPNSVNEVGCIHTCQGLEVDYIGVIVGPDLIVRNGTVITQPSERASTDKSISGWRARLRENPGIANTRLDAIIKNTYRTLMTRGQKGCFVYFVDEETRQFFANRIRSKPIRDQILEIVAAPEVNMKEVVLPFRRLPPEEVKPFDNCVPLYDLQAAAGQFSDEQQPSEIDWVELPDAFRHRRDLFVIQVVGESMNRRIPNGAWCLFRKDPGGTRQRKVVLVEHSEIADTDTGQYTVKVYESTKVTLPDGTWRHASIILHPDTTDQGYEPIVLDESQRGELKVIGELVAVLG